MPWVTIKTGMIAPDGQEAVLREYLCDSPDCAHVAEHLVGIVREVAMVRAVCSEHAAAVPPHSPDRGRQSRRGWQA